MNSNKEQKDEQLTTQELFEQGRRAQRAGDLTRARNLFQAVIDTLEQSEADPRLLADATAFRTLAEHERARRESSPLKGFFAVIIGLAFWALFISGIAAIFSGEVRHWWSNNWLEVIAGALALLGLLAFAAWIDRRIARQAPERRRVVVAFIIIPLITLAMMGIIGLKAQDKNVALELILVLVAALIPAAAYYLFLTTRRPSILNEFVANLSRLGLVSPRLVFHTTLGTDGKVFSEPKYESPEESHARIDGYFQRFEAQYGRLRFGQDGTTRAEFVRNLIDAITGRDRLRHMPESDVHIADIFRPALIIPIGLVTVLTTLGWLLTLQPEIGTGAQATSSTVAITPVWTPLPFAFLGAYFFGIQMLFRRFVRRDLGPNAYLAFANRIVLAMIAVWVALAAYQSFEAGSSGTVTDLLSNVARDSAWPASVLVVAFVIGVFPRVLLQFVGALISKVLRFKVIVPSLEAKQPLHELDGLTVWHETRLEEEDVENVPNMATVDLVDIMLHTQIPAERLTTWVDQAILLSTLGLRPKEGNEDPREKLRPLGLNTASLVVAAYNGTPQEKLALEHALGTDVIHTLAHALGRQANFEAVRAWRQEW